MTVAQVVAHDGTRLLLHTRSDQKDGVGLVAYGRILDLPRLLIWPEFYLETLLAHGQWIPLDDPVPADDLVARAKPAVLRSAV